MAPRVPRHEFHEQRQQRGDFAVETVPSRITESDMAAGEMVSIRKTERAKLTKLFLHFIILGEGPSVLSMFN
jgi:hypothetical protein